MRRPPTPHSVTPPMQSFEFEDGAIQVDATIVASGLGLVPNRFMDLLREGKITSLCEKGIDADSGRYRLTFFCASRRFRLVVDESGTIVQRSTLDYGKLPLPAAARRPAG